MTAPISSLMPNLLRRLVSLFCVALSGAAPMHASTPAVPSIDDLITPNIYRMPVLNAAGTRYAVVATSDTADTLFVTDLTTGKSEPVLRYGDGRIINLWSKGDKDYLMLVRRHDGEGEFVTFTIGDKESKSHRSLRRWYVEIVSPLPDDPDNVLIATPKAGFEEKLLHETNSLFAFQGYNLELRRFNIRTGKSEHLQLGSNDFTIKWVVDRQGIPRASVALLKENTFVSFATSGADSWRRVDLGAKENPSFVLLGLSPDGSRLIGTDQTSADTSRLVAWNPADDSKEVLLASEDQDITVSRGREGELSVVNADGRPKTLYLDPRLRGMHDQVSGAMPDSTINVVSTSADFSKAILLSTSERNPGTLYLLDRGKGRLVKLGNMSAKLNPSQLGATRTVAFKARDGLMLRAHITTPPGVSTALPAVILVGHSASPYEFDPLTQLLATRGYAVIQLHHRGLHGYGRKFVAAGDLQISTGIPDDIIDTIDWLAQAGTIDPKRVALHGTSVAGLSIFHTAARHPERIAAITNFHIPADTTDLHFTDFVAERYTEDEREEKFGGPGRQLAYLKSIDPVEALAQIRAASFHFYPMKPTRVYFQSAERLKKKLGPNTARTRFVDGGAYEHWYAFQTKWGPTVRSERNRIYGELIEFLDANVKSPQAP